MAKYKKGERVSVGVKGSREQCVGRLLEMKITPEGNLHVKIKKDRDGLSSWFWAPRKMLTIERVT